MFYKQTVLDKTVQNYDLDNCKELSSLDCFSIVNNFDDIEALKKPELKTWLSHDNFIIFGTGGSSLGGQCIHSMFQSNKNIRFVNNLDSHSLDSLFSAIDLEKTAFLCISKSGETLETICQTLLAIDAVSHLHNIKDKFVVITEDKQSSLREIAAHFGFTCLDHPKTIGGRFSVFSIVGMLPALLCGVDPLLIREGGKQVLNDFQNSSSAIKNGTSFVFDNFSKGKTEHVSFIYSDKFSIFGDWLAQLYAESSGKNNIGITPIAAIGAVDQHSQLQLYLDGQSNKTFTFFIEKQNTDAIFSQNFIPSAFKYLQGKRLSDVFYAQAQATLTSVCEKKSSVRVIEFSEISPQMLGSLFMHFMLEVACVCRLMKVNPFDQPAVERGKILTKSLLSETHVD